MSSPAGSNVENVWALHSLAPQEEASLYRFLIPEQYAMNALGILAAGQAYFTQQQGQEGVTLISPSECPLPPNADAAGIMYQAIQRIGQRARRFSLAKIIAQQGGASPACHAIIGELPDPEAFSQLPGMDRHVRYQEYVHGKGGRPLGLSFVSLDLESTQRPGFTVGFIDWLNRCITTHCVDLTEMKLRLPGPLPQPKIPVIGAGGL